VSEFEYGSQRFRNFDEAFMMRIERVSIPPLSFGSQRFYDTSFNTLTLPTYYGDLAC